MSDSIAEVLAQQRAGLESLRDVLEVEHRALLAADAAALPAIAERKMALFSQIETIEEHRRDLFDADPTAGSRADWVGIRSLADEVARANQRNGAVIGALMRGADAALQVLRGTDSGSFYGRQGLSTPTGGTSRPLADA